MAYSYSDFLFSILAYCVGIGNIWRFPYLCSSSGAGAFLIPYILMTLVLGVPLFYLEVAVGQVLQAGPAEAFGALIPALYGIGASTIMLSFLLSSYYVVVMAWCLYLVVKSSVNAFNDDNIFTVNQNETRYFWETTVLDEGRGGIAACLGIVWIFIYFTIYRGATQSTIVSRITIISAYVMIFALLARTSIEEGAVDGIYYFLNPRWEQLREPKVWINAAIQVFNSIGISFGSIVAFGSLRKQTGSTRRILADSVTIVMLNMATSLVSGLLIYSAIGVVSNRTGVNIEELTSEGIDLIFVICPILFGILPWKGWAILFFLTILLLGYSTEFAMIQSVQIFVEDFMTERIEERRWKTTLYICVMMVCLSIPTVMPFGMKYYKLMDSYTCFVSLMVIAFLEVGGVCWYYGADRLCRLINTTSNDGEVPWLIRISWKVVCPVAVLFLMLLTLSGVEKVTFKGEPYPMYAHVYGVFITFLSLACIPAGLVYVYLKQRQSPRSWRAIFSPSTQSGMVPVTYTSKRSEFKLQDPM